MRPCLACRRPVITRQDGSWWCRRCGATQPVNKRGSVWRRGVCARVYECAGEVEGQPGQNEAPGSPRC